MIPLSQRSSTDLEKALKHIGKMEGVVEQDARDLPDGDFSLIRDLLQRDREEVEEEIRRRTAPAPRITVTGCQMPNSISQTSTA